MENIKGIPTAAIYVFLILAFFVARWVFWLGLLAILLTYLFWPSGRVNELANTIFTNLTWVALAVVLLLLVLAIIGASVAGPRLKEYMDSARGMGFSVTL